MSDVRDGSRVMYEPDNITGYQLISHYIIPEDTVWLPAESFSRITMREVWKSLHHECIDSYQVCVRVKMCTGQGGMFSLEY